MSILVTCTCGKNYKLADSLAGRKAKCAACGASIIVPEVESLGDSSLLTLIDDDTPPSPEHEYELERPANYSRERPQTDYALDPSPTYVAPGETMASNPGRMRPSLLHYYKCYPTTPIILILGLSAAMMVNSRFNSGGAAVIAGSVLWFSISDLLHVRRKCRLGDVNPGLVVSVKPPLVAVLADVTKSEGGSCLALKILPQPLGRMTGAPPMVGMRVPTVSTYHGNVDDRIWNDFRPDVINCVTTNQQTIERKLASIPPDQWSALIQAVERLPEVRPGLYCMWQAGWRNNPMPLTSPLAKVATAVVILGISVGVVAILFGKSRDGAKSRSAPNISQPPERDLAQRRPDERFANPDDSEPDRADVPAEAGSEFGQFSASSSGDSNAPEASGTEQNSFRPQSMDEQPLKTESAETSSTESRKTARAETDAAPASGSAVDMGDLKVGDRLEVKWGNKWWPASVVKLNDGQSLVHYEGWSSTFDEWVGDDRIRPASSADGKSRRSANPN